MYVQGVSLWEDDNLKAKKWLVLQKKSVIDVFFS